MKSTFYSILLLSLACLLASCSKSDDDPDIIDCPSPPDWLIGTWESDAQGYTQEVIFENNDIVDRTYIDGNVRTETSAKDLVEPFFDRGFQVVKNTSIEYQITFTIDNQGTTYGWQAELLGPNLLRYSSLQLDSNSFKKK